MKLWLVGLLLLAGAPARAGQAQDSALPQATGFQIRQSHLLAEIAQWRSDYLYNPRGDGRLTALSFALDGIQNAAATATSESALTAARGRLSAWVRDLLPAEYREAVKRGMKGESFEQFVKDRSSTVEYYANTRSELDLAQKALSRLGQLYAPSSVSAPGAGRVPLPKSRPLLCAPSRLTARPAVPPRYAKARAQLVKEGADPVVVDNVIHFALAQKLDPLLYLAVIKKESHFDPKAVSKAGAQGLGQVMPATARDLGVHDLCKLREVETNLYASSRYLASLMKRFTRKADLAIAAYNAGPDRVRRSGGIPKILETQDYVKKIREFYLALKRLTP